MLFVVSLSCGEEHTYSELTNTKGVISAVVFLIEDITGRCSELFPSTSDSRHP